MMRDLIPTVMSTPGVIAASVYAGVDATTQVTASNAGQMYVIQAPFPERLKKGLTLDKMIKDLQQRVSGITGADIRVIPPPPVRGIGVAGGFKMIIESQGSTDYRKLEQVAHQVTDAALKDKAVGSAYVTFNTRTPRIFADIDREKAEKLGVPSSNVFDTLQTYLGSTYVNDFNLFGRTFQVYAQADTPYRTEESAITDLQTRSASGAMTPLGSVVTLRHETGPYRVLRYNLYPSAEIQGDSAPGASSGQTLAAMEKIAKANLPQGYSSEWTELAFQQKIAGDTGTLVFALAVVFVFLLLAALYESVTLPFSVILIVPMCILAALTGVAIRHMDNNILTQIGLIVLIGLAAKNAILIVEFARQGELAHGHERREAAEEAGRTRLRPILMTSFAFILGVIPLAYAKGAGAEMRQALGVAVFFGMIGVTLFGLVFTPVFYVVFRGLSDRLPKPPQAPAPTPNTANTAQTRAPGEPA
jgi:multidrug efflux pump subunit AcrB